MSNVIKVIIGDNHPLVHKGIFAILESCEGISIVGSAFNSEQLLDGVSRLCPDIVIMDIAMPKMNGIETLTQLVHIHRGIRVICLTGYQKEIDIVEVLRAGAKGFVLKDSEVCELVTAINTVILGNYYYCNNAINVMIRALLVDSQKSQSIFSFKGYSKTELEIIRLICLQKTTKEISEEICLGRKTVEYYRHRIVEKMKVRNTVGIVIFAIQNNMVNINYL